jgi:ribosomal protein S18 acetylase RimI-like enzyme
VRPAAHADLSALAPLAGSAERAYARLRAAETGDDLLLVAEHAQSVVAAVSVHWQGTCDAPNPWLYGLQVRPDVRRHGLGALLVRAAETVASLRGAGVMSLDVDRDEDRLLAYYERLGYERVAPHQHHWRSVDPAGVVTAEGVADTWVMRHRFGSPDPGR